VETPALNRRSYSVPGLRAAGAPDPENTRQLLRVLAHQISELLIVKVQSVTVVN
jgi:hypothetical protein